MAQKPKTMHQVKRILALHTEGKSIRQIARLTGVARNTVRTYLSRAGHYLSSSGAPPESLQSLDDGTFSSIVYREAMTALDSTSRYHAFEKQSEYFLCELSKRHVTRALLWEEYRQVTPDGYSYSQFCEHLSRHLKKTQAVMHFHHNPADEMQVDFAGDKLYYTDRSSGELIAAEVLVAVLPFSHYAYAVALPSQKQQDFITGICLALEYFGGVPRSIKCDNLRSAVTKSDKYEPQFTEAMELLAEHYQTTAIAARARKPRDKGSVEKAVDLAYKRLYAPLRHDSFYSIEEINAGLMRQLEALNARNFTGRSHSRKILFEKEEKPLLGSLPSQRYQTKHVRVATVQQNYHVMLGEDRHYYSVPYELIGKQLKLVYTADSVEIYDGQNRIAAHVRNRRRGYTTKAEHMPLAHRKVSEQRGWTPEYFAQQAMRIGEATAKVISRILERDCFKEQSYKSCIGVLRLADRYTKERLESACRRALASPVVNYTTIKNILERNLDQEADLFTAAHHIPEHHQIRGAAVYSQ